MFNKYYTMIISNEDRRNTELYWDIIHSINACGYKADAVSFNNIYTTITVLGTGLRFKKLIKRIEKKNYAVALNESKSFAYIKA